MLREKAIGDISASYWDYANRNL